jgi:hypothetical protein
MYYTKLRAALLGGLLIFNYAAKRLSNCARVHLEAPDGERQTSTESYCHRIKLEGRRVLAFAVARWCFILASQPQCY